jgi:hypothetical protein
MTGRTPRLIFPTTIPESVITCTAMLAGMDIAQAHAHAAAPAFNSLFYATAAGVVPVLYLALVVQGGGIDVLIRGAMHYLKFFRLTPWKNTPDTGSSAITYLVLITIYGTAAIIALAQAIVTAVVSLAGAVTEAAALWAIYKRETAIHSPIGPHAIPLGPVVLTGTGILLAATAIIPLAQVTSQRYREKFGLTGARPAEAASQEPPAPEPAATPKQNPA